MSLSELINVGLSEAGNEKLDWLKEQGFFADKVDAYRFAVGLALAHGVIPDEVTKRTTFLNVGSLDPDQSLKHAVEALLESDLEETTVYRMIERLADWGVVELYTQAREGNIDFNKIFDGLAEKIGS